MKYKAAMAYYDEEEYYKSTTLLDQVIPIIRGTVDGEKALFYRAYGYYHQKQYILSANYFKEFVKVYSRSEYALEAAYLHAYSLYLQSPDYNLDQASTYEAVNAFQTFLNKNPYTEYSERAGNMIDEMQQKLEKKAFENAKLYYKLQRWEAARVTFEVFEDEFPDSKLNEQISYMAIGTQFSYAKQSIRDKQKERYSNTIEAYLKFIDKYPDSKLLRDAEEMYAKSITELEKL